MKNIVVLISGNGSNLQALIDACQQALLCARISAVFSNRAHAYGLIRASQHKIATHQLNPKSYPNHETFDQALAQQIDPYQPDLLVLAGYLRILSPGFVQHYQGKILNIHPSLLPKYPGLNTHRQAISNGDKEHGASVHFVTDKLDGGPIILQAKVPILPNDTEEQLIQRVQRQEHIIYPQVIRWFVDGRLNMRGKVAWLDDQPLPPQGYTTYSLPEKRA